MPHGQDASRFLGHRRALHADHRPPRVLPERGTIPAIRSRTASAGAEVIRLTPRVILRTAVWVWLLSGCTAAQRQKATQTAKDYLDKACAVRASERVLEDAGTPDAGK